MYIYIYPLYYTTNELKRRRTVTDGEGKSSFCFVFFALAEIYIEQEYRSLYNIYTYLFFFWNFSDLKYRVRRPSQLITTPRPSFTIRGFIFLKSIFVVRHIYVYQSISIYLYIYLKHTTITFSSSYYYYCRRHISFITSHFFEPTRQPLPRVYLLYIYRKRVKFHICIRGALGLVVIVVGGILQYRSAHKRAFSVSIISLFILLPFTYI